MGVNECLILSHPALAALLAKYAEIGPAEFSFPDTLKNPPLSDFGNSAEISERFGGPAHLRIAVTRLQELLYAA